MHAHRIKTTPTCSLVSDLLNQCICHVDIGLYRELCPFGLN